MGGDSQVEQHAVDVAGAQLGEHVGELREAGVHEPHSRAEGGQALAGRGERLGIPVETDQLPVRRAALQDPSGVTPATQRSIHHHVPGLDAEPFERLVGHHGLV